MSEQTETTKKPGLRKTRVGVVTSTKMDKTIVVEYVARVPHLPRLCSGEPSGRLYCRTSGRPSAGTSQYDSSPAGAGHPQADAHAMGIVRMRVYQ